MNGDRKGQAPDWNKLIIAVVGGDEREQEICRLAAQTGALVRAFGFPWPASGINGVQAVGSPTEALRGAQIALFPIPGMTPDGAIFGSPRIFPDEKLLAHLADGAHIVLGRADAGLRRVAEALGIALHAYEQDRQLMLLRAPAIVEGVLGQIIENTDITIHDATICVIGQGNIGTVLTRTLILLGAHVSVAARDPVQRAAAYTLGAQPLHTDALADRADGFDIVCSTVPAALVTAQVIDRLPAHALVVDLAAPPGSCDLSYAAKTGRRAIWARALGRRAPITVGASQWLGIARIIEEIMAKKAEI